jgi:small ligand-binding sensory domain FIST
MSCKAVSILLEGPFSESTVTGAARSVREQLGAPATIAFAFITADYIPFLESFTDAIRVEGHVSELVGCTGSGIIHNGTEMEDGSGFSLLAIHAPGAAVTPFEFSQEDVDKLSGPSFWTQNHPSVESWLVLAHPFHLSVDRWLRAWNDAFPGIPTIGGLASGGRDEDAMLVFHNNHPVRGAVAVGFQGPLKLIPAVSQGCRPIGEPLPVTRAENNIIFSLGSRPAYQALESAFQSLTDAEKSSAQGNLFAGLASNEYVEEFKPGDFLIRNIIGADPNSGAVVIADVPRIGQTLQYQLRDSHAADADLRMVFNGVASTVHPPVASLLFCCTGRGTNLFGRKNHDAALLETILGPHSAAGFFCNGEIGPVSGKNCVHGYTASCAVFAELNTHTT